VFCVIALDQNIFFFSDKYEPLDYYHIGIWIIGMPAAAFAIGLATCWIVDGFRQRKPAEAVSSSAVSRSAIWDAIKAWW
jgi:hypothetical protein